MADDIVTRLRIIHRAGDDFTPCGPCSICQAADEIERLNEQAKLWKQTAGAWQATAAGLTQDISNAEDKIEQLQNEIQQLQTRKLFTPNSISGQHHQDARHTKTYGILIHETTDNNNTQATVIYKRGGTNEEGPWHPITTCDRDWAWEILDALQAITTTKDYGDLSSESLKD